MLKIVVDSAIPFAQPFFSRIGEVTSVDGDRLTPEVIHAADVLVCRTTTRVNQGLLRGSQVSVVASPSSGTDHVDLNYLQEAGINFVSAPGCNARAVAEYVLSALSVLAEQKGFEFSAKTAGIIGCGNVGSLVRQLLQATGIECMVYDPFLKAIADSDDYCEFDDLRQADIISLHVPLTTAGPYPSSNLLDAAFFQTLAKNLILINTSRGRVIDETALKQYLQMNRQAMAVIDVWTHEPEIDPVLLARADIATPHIAGYSLDGKLRATRSVFKKVCDALQLDSGSRELDGIVSLPGQHEIGLSQYESDSDAVRLAVLASYDIRRDAAALRRMLDEDETNRGAYFSELRNNYPLRREFSSLGIQLAQATESLRQKLLELGFELTHRK